MVESGESDVASIIIKHVNSYEKCCVPNINLREWSSVVLLWTEVQ